MTRLRRWLLACCATLALCAVGAAAVANFGAPGWRLEFLLAKALGNMPDVSWRETFSIVKPGSGFWMAELREQSNPFINIQRVAADKGEVERGGDLFQVECAACHGVGARGTGTGPALAGRALTRANSDWALYRVIAKGIPGTSMAAHARPWRDLWQLVAYVKSVKASVTPEVATISPPVNVPASAIAARDGAESDWLTYSGSYDGQRFSRLSQIHTANVQQLRVRWLHHIDTNSDRQQTVPLVSGGVMYFSASPATVMAVDAATGKTFWEYKRPVAEGATLCCGVVNRGVALLDNRVFLGTADAHLIALDANSGRLLWDQQVTDHTEAYAITSAPLAAGKLVITGISGGDFATRGFIAAYDAATGTPVWRFNTVPGPGEPGHETWSGDSWRTGGSATWMTGSYDPDSATVYWGIGNPAPAWVGDARIGDNLYSDSVVALDATTGKMRWHFQFTPHNVHDWDATQVPVLIDEPGRRPARRLLAWPNRNGFFYSLDAATGKFLQGRAFAEQTWATGLDPNGRPIPRPDSAPSASGALVSPSSYGATNWWPNAYNPMLELLFVPVLERPALYFRTATPTPEKGKLFMGGAEQGIEGRDFYTAVRALNPLTGERQWERRWPGRRNLHPESAGLLATAGGLVFGSDQGVVFALDAKAGNVLWTFDAGINIVTAPMSYAVDGVQYMAIAAGKLMMAFALPDVTAPAPGRR
jgi:alcohol dehydrogenase (cytochrome c)